MRYSKFFQYIHSTNRALIFLVSFFMPCLLAVGQRSIAIHKTSGPIKIDGIADEADWTAYLEEGDFIQNSPESGQPSRRNTQVAILYDDAYLYVLGVMHVPDREEINRRFTQRDDSGNSDVFAVQLDPFGEAREGYEFAVTAAGVQVDKKLSATDNYMDFNVVWGSEVRIQDDRWVAELKIPFNSIRFPKDEITNFRINFERVSSHLNEDAYWNPVLPQVDGFLNQFGKLTDLGNVAPPINLSLVPFTSVIYGDGPGIESTTKFTGGLDMKYVIDHAYTLDVSLIPDFSQALSDDRILNLTPFEVQYNENRQFFVEGTELFDKGGYLYTRRIGDTPINRGGYSLTAGERVVKDPANANILNLIKFTGRSRNGLSVGMLNGVTARSEATLEDDLTGAQRDVETGPLTNYNAFVLDKTLKNNSSITLLNNSVIRDGANTDNNLTALLYRWYDKDRNWSMYFKKAISQRYATDGAEFGHQYYAYLSRVGGNWTGGTSANLVDDEFDNNELGFLDRNNELKLRADLVYTKNDPKTIFSQYQIGLDHNRSYYASLMGLEASTYKLLSNGTLKKNNHTIFFELTAAQAGRDYFEARIKDQAFNTPGYSEVFAEYQTNPNKSVYFAGYAGWVNYLHSSIYSTNTYTGLFLRANAGQHVQISLDQDYSTTPGSAGYIMLEEGASIFGKRSIRELTNTVSLDIAVDPRSSFSVRLRHYWIQVDYSDQFSLTSDAELVTNGFVIDVDEQDDNYNTVNVDFVATWQFAPASQLSLSYKSGAEYFNNGIRSGYGENLSSTLDQENDRTISLKATYFWGAGK
ncbi:MAG: DUF5916 domain-containing protein [Flavobacteriales bacterium]